VPRIVDILGIEQGRRWGACTMNEFRKFVNLKEFQSFDKCNPDPTVARAAERLYGHIDNLELYTGLQCKATIPYWSWSLVAYWMKAVLRDAIALVRADGLYTSSFSPSTLTPRGIKTSNENPTMAVWASHSRNC